MESSLENGGQSGYDGAPNIETKEWDVTKTTKAKFFGEIGLIHSSVLITDADNKMLQSEEYSIFNF